MSPRKADPVQSVRRALLSVSDKTGLVELAKSLVEANVALISTGATANLLRNAGLEVLEVGEVTGQAEMFDGRLKTLHPRIHGSLLADLRQKGHVKQMRQQGWEPIDLAVVNLYPFAQSISNPECEFDQAIEQIDVGGPALVRSAAKNHNRVAVVVEPGDYRELIEALASGGTTLAQRRAWAAKAFAHTAKYDRTIGDWFAGELLRHRLADLPADHEVYEVPGGKPRVVRVGGSNSPNPAVILPDSKAAAGVLPGPKTSGSTGVEKIAANILSAVHSVSDKTIFTSNTKRGFSEELEVTGRLVRSLRYGENAHQKAGLYATDAPIAAGLVRPRGGEMLREGLVGAKLLGSKPMSYNNYLDVDAGLKLVYAFQQPTVCIIKHSNPCGVGMVEDQAGIDLAYQKAHASDPTSAFGGVVVCNRPVNFGLSRAIFPVFTEVLAAPGFDSQSLELLDKKKNLRILELGDYVYPSRVLHQISGGFLVQEADSFGRQDLPENWRQASGPKLTDEKILQNLAFAWKVSASVKSNAVLLVSALATVGVGMGQVNRVDACRLAVKRAGERARGAVAASDGFFPFADGLEALIDAGVKAVVHPGGSVRDQEVIAAAEQAGLIMFLTGVRHFAH